MKGLVQEIVAWVLTKIINHTLSDEMIDNVASDAGKWVTDNCRDKCGNAWEKLETELQYVTNRFVNRFSEALDYDDK